jgi:hypothetical protein
MQMHSETYSVDPTFGHHVELLMQYNKLATSLPCAHHTPLHRSLKWVNYTSKSYAQLMLSINWLNQWH